ncbi:hypothetical protein K502DRAFT_329156 [Neoconidiobolus thromboides FSU 785]|nr:hypothetical protein K502DRAFT_329156 [Neoconidiobolus thromboides FSU 785]
MKFKNLILIPTTFYTVFSIPLQHRDNNPLDGLLNMIMGGGSDGGVLESLFGGSGPIAGLIANINNQGDNKALKANLLVTSNNLNKKEIGNGVINDLLIHEENSH